MLTLKPLHPDRDCVLLHSWFTQPSARYWGLGQATVEDVRREYRRIDESPHHQALLGEHDGVPRFLVERYDPVAATYDPEPGDVGMHFLVGPAVRRVVSDPEVRNTKVHRLNDLVGFEKSGIVTLPDKEAWLSFCTLDQHSRALRMNEAG